MTAMSHAWQHVNGGVLDTDDGDRSVIPGAAEDAGPMPRIRGRVSDGVADNVPPESEKRGTGKLGGVNPPPP